MNFSSIKTRVNKERAAHSVAGLLLVMLSGCLDTASNYGTVLPPVKDDDNGGSNGGNNGGNQGDGDTNDDDTGDGDTSGGDGDQGGGGGDTTSVIKGSAMKAGCSSYQAREGDNQCAGYYCGVSKKTIEAELKPGTGKCSPTAEDVCAGTVTTRVAKCARETKSNPLNALDSDAVIREKTLACVKMDPAIDSTDECLGCFLDAAQCASKNCLTQCLTGDSANCDDCRLKNNCNQPVPICAGLPSPF